jgi:hypothetical protein
VQWVLLLAALVGAVWLGALAVMGYLRMPEPGTPDVVGVPLPTLLLLGGVLAGVLLALLSRALIAGGARARARKAEQRLRNAVARVSHELVVQPLQVEIDAYRTTTDGLRTARR